MESERAKLKKQSVFKELWRRYRKNPAAMAGLVFVVILIVCVILGDVIAPYKSAISQNVRQRLQTPSAAHFFGTDDLGRDEFARVVHGARSSLALGVVTTLIALSVGGVLGSAAGYFMGRIDDVIMRLMDVLTSIPSLLLSLAVVSALGPGVRNLIAAITISRVPAFVRIVRSAVLTIADQEFIEAALAGGSGDARVILRHVIPNALGPIIVQATMSISQLILQAASLSFLGMGVQPPRPEWGAMLNEAREFMRVAPHMMIFPGMAIVLSALSFNLVGDGLRDVLDPKLKN
ncbi:MAG: ABC transporter permease [Synergistaceae bacterium]|jgi:peptide/nickel transport system permease protein|nr:ABC transporter permease [Synergistaceae bacterium]